MSSPPLRVDASAQTARLATRMDQVSCRTRDIRLVSGLVLMTFAATHFLNHALGIFGIRTMEAAQEWRYWVWHTWPGTILLYGAFIVHPLFALIRVAERRTFRMPTREIVQILLGLTIPILLVDHIVATRVQSALFGFDQSYSVVLRNLWPSLALTQSLLLLLVWTHGVLGLHFILRSRPNYARWRDLFLLAAILVPILALTGFMVAGREAEFLATPRELQTEAQSAMFYQNVMRGKLAFFGLVAIFIAFVVIREVRVRTSRPISVRFVGHGVRRITPGLTVLEMFRRFGIPHAALCGGKARCATCRVLVVDGGDELPPPSPNEARLLRRISAPNGVRLACQIRPQHDIQVQLLLSGKLRSGGVPKAFEVDGDVGRKGLTVLVADLRAFTSLSERQLPHDLIGLLNRFYDEMNQAISAHGGRIGAVYGDGLMAAFGFETTPGEAAAAAIAAAGDMVLAIDALNREFSAALPLPLRIGIGIHGGQATVGALQHESFGRREITVGETVLIARQLQSATRRVLADIVVSAETVEATRRRYQGTVTIKVPIQGRDKSITAYGFVSPPEPVAKNAEKLVATTRPSASVEEGTG